MLKNPHWKNCPVSVFPPQRIDWFQPFLPGGPLTLNLSDVTSAAKGDIRGSTKVLGCHQLLNLGETFNKNTTFHRKTQLPYSPTPHFPSFPIHFHHIILFTSTWHFRLDPLWKVSNLSAWRSWLFQVSWEVNQGGSWIWIQKASA